MSQSKQNITDLSELLFFCSTLLFIYIYFKDKQNVSQPRIRCSRNINECGQYVYQIQQYDSNPLPHLIDEIPHILLFMLLMGFFLTLSIKRDDDMKTKSNIATNKTCEKNEDNNNTN